MYLQCSITLLLTSCRGTPTAIPRKRVHIGLLLPKTSQNTKHTQHGVIDEANDGEEEKTFDSRSPPVGHIYPSGRGGRGSTLGGEIDELSTGEKQIIQVLAETNHPKPHTQRSRPGNSP